LMDWGNVIIDEIHKKNDNVVSLNGHLHLEGNVKDTQKKLTWLADSSDNTKVKLIKYGYLITKKKIEKDEDFVNFVNKNSKIETLGLGDPNLRSLNKGDRMQLERRGYFICEECYLKPDQPMTLILIPDGHTSKVQSVLTEKDEKEEEGVDDPEKFETEGDEGGEGELVERGGERGGLCERDGGRG